MAGRKTCCCCGLDKGRWTAEDDKLLIKSVNEHDSGNWPSVSRRSGLQRCRKSCRLRWTNHLRPGIKKGNIKPAEEDLIIKLHEQKGNRWSHIAKSLPGRTDHEIKNYWNNHLKKKLESQETDHLDDKLVIGSSSHEGGNELGNDVSKLLLRVCTTLLRDDDDVQGLDLPNYGEFEKIYKEFSELLPHKMKASAARSIS